MQIGLSIRIAEVAQGSLQPFREPKIRIRLLHRTPDHRDRSGWVRILVGLDHQFASGRLAAGWFPVAARPKSHPLSPTNRSFLVATGATRADLSPPAGTS